MRNHMHTCIYSCTSYGADILCTLWQYNLDCGLLNNLVIKNMVDESHPEHVAASRMVQVLVGGDVVSNVVPGLPAAKQREPGGR